MNPAGLPGAPAATTETDTAQAAVVDPVAAATPSATSRRSAAVARIALLGAAGYAGQEFLRLALRHPGLDVVALGSREFAGARATDLALGLDPADAAGLPPVLDPAALGAQAGDLGVDTVVACLPHGAWRGEHAGHPGWAGARVVDLSADHRDGGDGYIYGLPEAYRSDIGAARRVANPGCYATALALALLPAAADCAGPVMASALSGVSGAGRAAVLRTGFVEAQGGAWLYRAGTEHGHIAEVERALSRLGARIGLAFAPQVVPMARGILLTAFAPLQAPWTPAEARARYVEHYAGEPFVRVLPAGEWPETRAVAGSNRCDLAVSTVHGGHTLLATAALDNLVKGAAGQAIQNLNLQLGWPEATGLPVDGRPW